MSADVSMANVAAPTVKPFPPPATVPSTSPTDVPPSAPAPPLVQVPPATNNGGRGEADNEAAMLLLSFGAAADIEDNIPPVPDAGDGLKREVAVDAPAQSAAVRSAGSMPPVADVDNAVASKSMEAVMEPATMAPIIDAAVGNSSTSASMTTTPFQALPQQMPPPPSVRPSSPHAGPAQPQCPPSSTMPVPFFRLQPQQQQQPPSAMSTANGSLESPKSVSFAPVMNGMMEGPIMGRFDVKPVVVGDAMSGQWQPKQPFVVTSDLQVSPPAAATTPSARKQSGSSAAGGQSQRKRKRSTSTSTGASAEQRQPSLPLAPLAIIPPNVNEVPPGPTSTNPHLRPDLPHFMGVQNQAYRCICGTSVEPDKGTSTQCESCCAWQHAECFGLTEDDLQRVTSYFCHLCKPRDVHPNAAYIAELQAIAQATKDQAEAVLADDTGNLAGSAYGGSGGRGAKKARGGAGGKSRTRVREPSDAATSIASGHEPPATPASARMSQPPGGNEDAPGTSVASQEMPPPATTARPPRKKPATSRPPKSKAIASLKGAASPSGTPTGSNTVPGSPDIAPRDLSHAGSVAPSLNVGYGPASSSDMVSGALALRILEYTPTSKNIPRDIGVRKVLTQFMQQWVDKSQPSQPMTSEHQDDAASVAGTTAGKDIHQEDAPADEGGEMDVDNEAPADSQRVSADVPSSRKRRHLSPSWGSEADYSILGAPIPPVILQGPTLSSLASRVEVREEKDDCSSLPAGLRYSPTTPDTRFDNVYLRPTVYGVHAIKSAPEGTYFGEYRGEIMTAEQYQSDRINQYWELGMTKPFVHRIGPPLDIVIDARRYGNDLRFIRSGCHPNVVLRPLLHYDDNDDENAHVELSFGIFASTRIPAGKELIIGWEWDDHHVLHNLRAFALEVESNSPFPSRTNDIPRALQQKFAVVMKCVAGLFSSCACTERMDCALVQMQRLGAGLPMLAERDAKDGRAKQKNRKIGVSDKPVKLDLGPLVGVARKWRADEETRRSVRIIRSMMMMMTEKTAPVGRAAEDAQSENEVDKDRVVEEDVGGVDVQANPVSREVRPDADMEHVAAPAPPPPQSPSIADKPISPATTQVPALIAETGELPSTQVVPAIDDGNQEMKVLQRSRKTSSATRDSPLSSLVGLQDLPEPDAGEISDSSTLTEPLTHASLSDQEDDEIPEEASSALVKVVTSKSPKVLRVKKASKASQRPDSFRRNRRIMSPSSPIIASSEQDVEAETPTSPSMHQEPVVKRLPKPAPEPEDVHFQPVKKAKRRRVMSDNAPHETASSAPQPTKAAVTTLATAVTNTPPASREAGMTPELEDLPEGKDAVAGGTGTPEPSAQEPARLASQPPVETVPVEEPAEPASVEAAAPPKRRRIDLKRFAVSSHPPATAAHESDAAPLPTPASDLSTTNDTPLESGSALGLDGFYPWSTDKQGRPDELATDGPATEGKSNSAGDSATNWWARSNPGRSFSLSSQLHSESTATSKAANSPWKASSSPEKAPPVLLTSDFSTDKQTSVQEEMPDGDASRSDRVPPTTPSALAKALPNGYGDSGHKHGGSDGPSSRDENSHLYQEIEADVKPYTNGFGHSHHDEQKWAAVPPAIPRRDVPPHVESDRERSTFAGRSSPPSKHPPTGPRGTWASRDDHQDHLDRERDLSSRSRDDRSERDWDGSRESRDVPRGPRSDFRGRPPSSTAFASPGRSVSGFAPPSVRASPYAPRGGWHGDSYRGRGRGGEPYRGRGGFGRGRGGGGGAASFYASTRGRP